MYSIYQLQAILDKAEVWLTRNWVKSLERSDRNLRLRCYDIFQLKNGLEWHLSGASTITDDFTQKAFLVLNSYITPIGDYDIAVIDGYVPTIDTSLNSLYIIDNNFSFLQGAPGKDGKDGVNGTNGISAYQSWLNQGNTGTEAAFVASTQGKTGAPGPAGIGTPGADGQSAYQIWLANGHAGTQQDFLNSLIGAQGLSAYQQWLANGNTGTINDFFNSLKGPKGDPGQFPVSMIIPMASSQAPSGFLYCNGQPVSRSVYAALFAAIGITYGVGDGSTTFALPDYRGEFLRGFDDGRGFDPGRVFGTHQDDEFKSHAHGFPGTDLATNGVNAIRYSGEKDLESGTEATGGAETRPKNMPVYYYIKY